MVVVAAVAVVAAMGCKTFFSEAWLLVAGPSARHLALSRRGWSARSRVSTEAMTQAEATGVFKTALSNWAAAEKDPVEMGKLVSKLEEAVDAGIPEVSMLLGKIHFDGLGSMQVDEEKGMEYYMQAANDGHEMASLIVGVKKLKGTRTMPAEKYVAAKYFKAAADKGSTQAMYMLANMLMAGDGIPKDAELAKEWIIKLAQKDGRFRDIVDKVKAGNLDASTTSRLQEFMQKFQDLGPPTER